MTHWGRLITVVGVGVLLGGSVARGGERVDALVRPKITTAPANVRITVRLARTTHDRSLTVEIDSGLFYRSSTRSLEGGNAPSVHEFEFVGLPSGSYEVRCSVNTDNGENPEERSLILVE